MVGPLRRLLAGINGDCGSKETELISAAGPPTKAEAKDNAHIGIEVSLSPVKHPPHESTSRLLHYPHAKHMTKNVGGSVTEKYRCGSVAEKYGLGDAWSCPYWTL